MALHKSFKPNTYVRPPFYSSLRNCIRLLLVTGLVILSLGRGDEFIKLALDLGGQSPGSQIITPIVFATSSLYVHKGKKDQTLSVPPSGLLRVTIGRGDDLAVENIPDFRDWFIRLAPDLASAAALTPDEGGLNIEGLAWDPHRQALLFGLRGPVPEGKPLVIPVRVKNLNVRWVTDNLEMLPPIRLSPVDPKSELGVRGLEYIESLGSFLVIIGRSISGSKAPFSLYRWDGRQAGTMKRLKVSFAEHMKPEDVCEGKVGGRPMLMFVDDGGGYQVLWLDRS